MIPDTHQQMLDAVQRTVAADPRFVGLLAGGSLLHGGFDEYSDLDFVVVVTDDDHESVLSERRAVAERMGELLAAFTGEHVGEPRLLICLFGDPPVHVDLKFVTPSDLDAMVESPLVLWTRDPEIRRRIDSATIAWPERPREWFEERFWIWMHYGATKLERGELYEAVGMLGFLREQVLGPLIHGLHRRPQRGVRRLEAQSPDWADRLRATVAGADRSSIHDAMLSTITLYRELRGKARPPWRRVESVVTAYVERIAAAG